MYKISQIFESTEHILDAEKGEMRTILPVVLRPVCIDHVVKPFGITVKKAIKKEVETY